MTVVIGLPRDERAPAAMALGGLLARSLGEDMVVCTVVPEQWPPGFGRVDAEYHEFMEQDAADALERARALLPAGADATFEVARARSTSVGLLEVAQRHGAGLLALGSSTAGVLGRVAFGSVAERLLHSSPLPVALAPRGFRARPDTTVSEVTAAFAASEGAEELVVAVAGVAARVGATLRIASFAVRPRTPLTAGIGSRAEDSVLNVWSADVARAQEKVLAEVSRLPHAPAAVSRVIGTAPNGPRRWRTSAGTTAASWPSGRARPVRSSGCSSAPVRRRLSGSHPSRSSCCPAAPPTTSPPARRPPDAPGTGVRRTGGGRRRRRSSGRRRATGGRSGRGPRE
jgi:nucleotide-binding universal stress UspA family protein